MDALKLKDAVVIGRSNGCDDAYGYFRTYGTDNVSAFVCIDETPRQTSTKRAIGLILLMSVKSGVSSTPSPTIGARS